MDIWSLWAVALPFIYRLKLYTFFFNERMMLPFIDSDLLYRGALWDMFDCILFNKTMVRNSTTLGWIFRHGHFWRYQSGDKEWQTIQWPKEQGQTTIYKTLYRKQKINQHKPLSKPGVHSDVPGWVSSSRRGKQFPEW